MRRLLVPFLGVAGLIASTGLFLAATSADYTVSVVLPNAANLFEGGSVMQNGYSIGSVENIGVEGDQARVSFTVDDEFAPLHDGATVRVSWKAVLGERRLVVTDGLERNPAVPSGGMLKGEMAAPVEVDQVLAALDRPTRKRLASLIGNINGILQGREQDVNATLRTAGPALHELGAVLRGLGTDGEAIRQLAMQLNETMAILARRDRDIEQVVQAMDVATGTVVEQRQAISQVLHRLPGTLYRAKTTLDHVPGVVDETAPLLDDLAPVSERLPSVARNLRPVLTDLRPTIAELRPTLEGTSELLGYTPELLDTGRATLPEADRALTGLAPALDFLRPYTPELAGMLANWGSKSANYDANGHYARIYIQAGMENANVSPGVTGPGVKKNPTPYPGELVGQPWTDAAGSRMR